MQKKVNKRYAKKGGMQKKKVCKKLRYAKKGGMQKNEVCENLRYAKKR